MLVERFGMIGQLFAQRGNLFGCNGTGVVSPITSFVRENVGNFLVRQCFVPRLHYSGAVLLTFNFDGALQPFKNNHRRPTRAASCKFGTGQRWILAGHTETTGLVTRLAIRSENLFAAIVRRKFCRLLCTLRSGSFFHRCHFTAVWIKRFAAKVSRVTAEIRAAKKYRQPVNRNQPNRERLSADTRFAFFALNSGVHLLDVGLFAVIHSLANARRRFRFFVHCVFILLARGNRRLRARVMRLVIPRRAVPLRQI